MNTNSQESEGNSSNSLNAALIGEKCLDDIKEIVAHAELSKELFDILWDNGDYILEINGNLSKCEAVVLAENTKIIKN